jgi:heme-degrading monooxygenase HmoA
MFAVIFKAKTGQQDQQYFATVEKMRELAFSQYGCLEFIAVTEGEQEIALSYWPDEESIRRWKNDPAHMIAQQQGRDKWYRGYDVQVVEVKRQYSF